jgi:hypothetical protein
MDPEPRADVVPEQEDYQAALDDLRERENEASRYNRGGREEKPETPEEGLPVAAGLITTINIFEFLGIIASGPMPNLSCGGRFFR